MSFGLTHLSLATAHHMPLTAFLLITPLEYNEMHLPQMPVWRILRDWLHRQ